MTLKVFLVILNQNSCIGIRIPIIEIHFFNELVHPYGSLLINTPVHACAFSVFVKRLGPSGKDKFVSLTGTQQNVIFYFFLLHQIIQEDCLQIWRETVNNYIVIHFTKESRVEEGWKSFILIAATLRHFFTEPQICLANVKSAKNFGFHTKIF